jgi:hypothetical protein
MASNSKIKGNTSGVVGAIVIYAHSKGASTQSAVSDASSNHSSTGLSAATYIISASAPGFVFRSVSVTVDGVNDVQDVNLRSRALGASNANQGGF